jgi:CRISPR-associated protein (TIGR02710 family)
MPRGAIFSLGGTPAPIIEALKRRPVECALFVVSEKSEPQVEQALLPAIGYPLQWECVRLDDPDDLNACYQQIRFALSGWLDRRRLRSEEVYFDLTGGTKPMSAALTLAAVERIPFYHYVSGEREKEGLGTVIAGTERPIAGPNPWMQLAIRQRELATQLYEQGHVEAAAELLDQAAQIASERSETLKAFARLCRVLAKLDLFQFRDFVTYPSCGYAAARNESWTRQSPYGCIRQQKGDGGCRQRTGQHRIDAPVRPVVTGGTVHLFLPPILRSGLEVLSSRHCCRPAFDAKARSARRATASQRCVWC